MSISAVIPVATAVSTAARRYSPPPPSALLRVMPGQLWLVEIPAAKGAPAASLRQVFEQANVVIYDRALADVVAGSLPLGGYAELGPSTDEASDRAAARAVHFASDGWSVARLVPEHPTQRERIVRVRQLAAELAATRSPGDVAVTVVGELADGVREPTQTRLDRLDLVVVTYPRDARLTIVVDGIGDGQANLHAVAGNGLAG